MLWAGLTSLLDTGFSTIYRSNNAGASWTRFDDGINASTELRSLSRDPQNHNIAPLVAGDHNSINWYDYSANATLVSSDTWQINLTAGGFGSYRPEPDAIRFVGGPACLDPVLFGNGFESAAAAPTCPN